MPIKKIKFPDGTVRRVKVREGQTREEIREKVMAAYESEVASQDPDLPFASNIQDAESRAEAQRGPEPGIWERALAIADAGLTMGQNAIGGAVMAPFANAQALANSATRGDFGTYEGARRTQQEAGERTGRYMSDTVTHSMQQAARVSQKTAFFHLGNLVEYGETSNIFTNPVDPRTESYITGRIG